MLLKLITLVCAVAWVWGGIGVARAAELNAAVAVSESELWAVEAQILAQTNAERSRFGMPPLTIDRTLLQSARNHCYWMASSRSLQHTGAAVAENIAMGQGSTGQAIRDWMNSPGHRANMLNGSYRRIGIAAYQTSSGTIYWCQQFLW